MGKAEDFVFDSKNLCFLCFRPAKITAAGVKRRVKDKTFSLRSLSRYMNVDFQKMARGQAQSPSSSSSTQQEGESGKFSQVLVTVCSRCSAVTEEFENLYQYLEFTQMKMDACFRNMNELIKKTNSNPRLVDKFRMKMKSTSSSSDDAQILEKIREKIGESCSSVVRSAFPRVQLQSFETNTQNKRAISKSIEGVKPSPRSKKPQFSSTILKKTSSVVEIKKELVTIDDVNFVDDPYPETNNKGGLFQCLHCDNKFNDTGGLRIHIVRYHREQFFSMFKIPTISEEDFKVAVELLFQDVHKITANSGAQSTVSYVCSCCGKPFSAQIDTYVHMVQLHHDALSTKLQNIQKNTSLIASAKIKVQLPDPSKIRFRGKRGPYKKKNAPSNVVVNCKNKAVVVHSKKERTFKQNKFLNIAMNQMNDLEFPRTCLCGVLLSSKTSWYNHQKMHCKLKSGKVQPQVKTIQATSVQHSSLKRAKNAVGFPRTCACGVRLSMRTSWNNHQKFHCKLKFTGKSKTKAGPSFLNSQIQNVIKQGRKRVMKNEGQQSHDLPSKKEKIETDKPKDCRYECKCGVSCNSYRNWYYHKTKACKLRDAEETFNLELDLVEEIPIDITPSGDLCLPSTSTSIDISPVPKIMKVTSAGGVIKGLQKMTNFQVKKEETKSATMILKASSYSDMFSKYLPIVISKEEIDTSLKKVLEEYRKFPGNISGCPYCGRGFTQVLELQNHMVEGHFEEVLSKLKNLIDPSGMAQCSNDDGNTINVDPGLVKTENMMEIDGSAELNDLCTMGSPYSQEFPPDFLKEENDIENATDEIESSYANDENEIAINDGDDQFLILP